MSGFPFTPWVPVPRELGRLLERAELSHHGFALYCAMLVRADYRDGVLSVTTSELERLARWPMSRDSLRRELVALRTLGLLGFDDFGQGHRSAVRFVVMSRTTVVRLRHDFRKDSGSSAEVTSARTLDVFAANPDALADTHRRSRASRYSLVLTDTAELDYVALLRG